MGAQLQPVCRLEDPRAVVKWLQYLRITVYLTALTGVCLWSITGEPYPHW